MRVAFLNSSGRVGIRPIEAVEAEAHQCAGANSSVSRSPS